MSDTITGVEVKLIGKDGNAFAIMGAVVQAMRRAKVAEDTINKYKEEMMPFEYNKGGNCKPEGKEGEG
jgi:hypothetical protein